MDSEIRTKAWKRALSLTYERYYEGPLSISDFTDFQNCVSNAKQSYSKNMGKVNNNSPYFLTPSSSVVY